ncbi:hypothetical protein [Planomonospora parontospora]|uniref:hypothetical protein n=1 Tax=Planomonospora parontospora TaxID=58119 RepID=UPI001670957B|nr:hypothetical protein [Planomonospora parontospora]GGL43669.1 hypothetical protein GCM10014719_51340 [Planomonospora parontospora subsp. antibiotica]GII18458.1 hypothetical protein Ppa05_51840 [Planomonospora parontospora subsp. antibiotica]
MTSTSRSGSGLVLGSVAGLVAALVGAAAYGAVIGVTDYEIGIAAIGVGVLVGLAMMAVRPTSPVLPALAAVFSFAGAGLGVFIGDAWADFVNPGGSPLSELLPKAQEFPDLVAQDPVTLLFWAIAGAAGFSFVNSRVKAARESLTAPSSPQQDEAPTDYFKPHNPA